jgi:hypothetical protein
MDSSACLTRESSFNREEKFFSSVIFALSREKAQRFGKNDLRMTSADDLENLFFELYR